MAVAQGRWPARRTVNSEREPLVAQTAYFVFQIGEYVEAKNGAEVAADGSTRTGPMADGWSGNAGTRVGPDSVVTGHLPPAAWFLPTTDAGLTGQLTGNESAAVLMVD